MLVDSDNFQDCKQEIIEAINQSEFLAIDLELTGIKGEYQDTFEELPAERYLKLRKVSMKYNIVQFGICPFIKTPDGYKCQAYTIYLFPSDPEDFVGLQIGAIQFNNEHGMDWNRWLRKGVSYLNEGQLTRLENQLQQKETYETIILEIKPDDQKQFQYIIDQIKEFSLSDKGEATIETKNSYQRKLVYTYLESKHQLIMAENQNGGLMKISKISQQVKDQIDLNRQQALEQKYQSRAAFNVIWQSIVSQKKPIVGHNCFGDIMFCYSHFIGLPPIQVEQFKVEINKRLPIIYDTKYIFAAAPSLDQMRQRMDSSSSVENLAEFLKMTVPQILVKHLFEGQQFYHTAGYDAFMTGFNFIHMMKCLTDNEKDDMKNILNLFKNNQCVNLQGLNRKNQQIRSIFIRLPEHKNNQQNNKRSQFDREMKTINNYLNPLKLGCKLIHFMYIYVEINQIQDYEKIEQGLRELVTQELKGCSCLNENQYEEERREKKEKEAKLDRFDRKY